MATCERCEESGKKMWTGGRLCVACAESGYVTICDVCGGWYDGDARQLTEAGWLAISEGPEQYCPEHIPADLTAGSFTEREEAEKA